MLYIRRERFSFAYSLSHFINTTRSVLHLSLSVSFFLSFFLELELVYHKSRNVGMKQL